MSTKKNYQVTIPNVTLVIQVNGVARKSTAIRHALKKIKGHGMISYKFKDILVEEIKNDE